MLIGAANAYPPRQNGHWPLRVKNIEHTHGVKQKQAVNTYPFLIKTVERDVAKAKYKHPANTLRESVPRACVTWPVICGNG